eukprot:m.74184 g.74184  ORF g.74184 m.74184 type:complete len:232 (+) comp13072_c0_seq3:208-903(+)
MFLLRMICWLIFCLNADCKALPNARESPGKKRRVKRKKEFEGKRVLALDCEMVEVLKGTISTPSGSKEIRVSALARCSIVDWEGNTLMDVFVKPTNRIVDYRTEVSGIRPEDIARGAHPIRVRKRVAKMLKGAVVVGHSVQADFRVLGLRPDLIPCTVRDSASCLFLREESGLDMTRAPSLKQLLKSLLGKTIQTGEHSSVQDALACMELYKTYREAWEEEVGKPRPAKKK